MSLLEVVDLSISFGGVQALAGVTLSVEEGEMVGLVGPNGAGKTTLFNCLCGNVAVDEGSVRFDGVVMDRLSPYQRARLGIRRTFQRVEVFPDLSVEEHLLVAERARLGQPTLWRALSRRGRESASERVGIQEMMERFGLLELAGTPVAALSLGQCRLVELARALQGRPRMLLADEPSSGLDAFETAELASTLRSMCEEEGVTLVLVEHDLDMVRKVVGRAVVLDLGRIVALGSLEQVLADPQVRRAYLGEEAPAS